MNENRPGEENLKREFEVLGRNLIEALHAAWEAPESRRFRDEMAGGLNELSSTLKREAENLATSPAAQKVQNSIEGVGDKLRTPEMQDKVRRELIGALQTVNLELQKVIDRWSSGAAGSPKSPVEDVNPPVSDVDSPATDEPTSSNPNQA